MLLLSSLRHLANANCNLLIDVALSTGRRNNCVAGDRNSVLESGNDGRQFDDNLFDVLKRYDLVQHVATRADKALDLLLTSSVS